MAGTTDQTGTPLLMVAYNGESCVRLYKLPEFSCRGVLTPVSKRRFSSRNFLEKLPLKDRGPLKLTYVPSVRARTMS